MVVSREQFQILKQAFGLISANYYRRNLILSLYSLNTNVQILDKLVHKTSSLATLLITHRL